MTRNVVASVRDRLKMRSRAPGGLAYHLLVDQYVNERLLYRLARSPYGDKFVLKGAMMFGIWLRDVKRPTQDIDLLGSGEPDPEEFAQLLRDVLSAEMGDDGVSFDLTSIKVTVATRNRAYPGLSTDLNARFGKEQVRVHIDVGFGDTITPAPRRERYPSLLDLPAPELFVYPKETSMAEKFSTILALGLENSRMKDYYDLWLLSQRFELDTELLRAVDNTLTRRGIPRPTAPPIGLSDAMTADPTKAQQWSAYVRKAGVEDTPPLHQLVSTLYKLFSPTWTGAQVDRWTPGGPWRSAEHPPMTPP